MRPKSKRFEVTSSRSFSLFAFFLQLGASSSGSLRSTACSLALCLWDLCSCLEPLVPQVEGKTFGRFVFFFHHPKKFEGFLTPLFSNILPLFLEAERTFTRTTFSHNFISDSLCLCPPASLSEVFKWISVKHANTTIVNHIHFYFNLNLPHSISSFFPFLLPFPLSFSIRFSFHSSQLIQDQKQSFPTLQQTRIFPLTPSLWNRTQNFQTTRLELCVRATRPVERTSKDKQQAEVNLEDCCSMNREHSLHFAFEFFGKSPQTDFLWEHDILLVVYHPSLQLDHNLSLSLSLLLCSSLLLFPSQHPRSHLGLVLKREGVKLQYQLVRFPSSIKFLFISPLLENNLVWFEAAWSRNTYTQIRTGTGWRRRLSLMPPDMHIFDTQAVEKRSDGID